MPAAASASDAYTRGDPCAAKTVRMTSNGYVATVAVAPAIAPPANDIAGDVGFCPAADATLRNSPSAAN
eukprot:8449-Pelagococcus_subviridis.AAC.2